jgi:hypothetical protein
MAWTYNPTQLGTSTLYQVRFYVGDTDSTRQLVQDEEILFVLTEEPSPKSAAAVVCDSLAGKFSQYTDASVDGVSQSGSQLAEAFRQRAKDLRDSISSTVLPVFGGIYHSQKDALDQDPSMVQPSFRIGADDNPDAPNERRSATYPWWRSN